MPHHRLCGQYNKLESVSKKQADKVPRFFLYEAVKSGSK